MRVRQCLRYVVVLELSIMTKIRWPKFARGAFHHYLRFSPTTETAVNSFSADCKNLHSMAGIYDVRRIWQWHRSWMLHRQRLLMRVVCARPVAAGPDAAIFHAASDQMMVNAVSRPYRTHHFLPGSTPARPHPRESPIDSE